MTEPAPVHNPAEQVEYWITQGIVARTNLSQDEARKSANHLLHQYHKAINLPRYSPASIDQIAGLMYALAEQLIEAADRIDQ